MQGRRRPDVHADAEGRYLMSWADYEPGDYWRLVDATGKATWYIKDPAGDLGHISAHTVIENPDGSITVSPSILSHGPGRFHGWLRAGSWEFAQDSGTRGGPSGTHPDRAARPSITPGSTPCVKND